MSTQPPDYTGMTDEDIARAKASDANLAGIIAGRRRAAKALLVTTRDPERQARKDFAPLAPKVKPTLPKLKA